ncbi:MAG TPA: glycosyltransferase [Vitreimonas sp.]|uniref:glycosyltransferase n=1 Tax=Vitreimonas sp. TaxID=3069702 RepID=UPI002D74F94C|nr:glycosyltransferase [Vitreimonas sp.]HYD86144.1 glycosyltransferase [Vitreimonas sp.]
MTVAIVTPVFEDQQSFAELCQRLAEIGRAASIRFHIIAVDDGSLGAPPRIEALREAGVSGEILRLARNVGHQMAIAIGLAHAHALPNLTACIVMDSDGEDTPESIPRLLAAVQGGAVDVATAQRAKRSETLTFQTFYAVYKRLFKVLTGQRLRFGNFMALTPRALERMSGMHETSTHVAAAVVKARLRRADVPTDRGRRYAGQSRMNFPSLVLHGMRAVMVFADLVLTRMALALVAMAAIVVLVVIAALAAKLLGATTPGWVTLVTGFALTLFVQTGLFTMITLIVSSLGRVDTPPRVRERALEYVAEIERTDASAAIGFTGAGVRRPAE